MVGTIVASAAGVVAVPNLSWSRTRREVLSDGLSALHTTRRRLPNDKRPRQTANHLCSCRPARPRGRPRDA